MIVVRLSGGLGNQMFQYAAGRALAERHDTELVLDSSWTVVAEKPYELGCFDLRARLTPVWEVARVPNPSRAIYALQRLRPRRRRFLRVVAEESSSNAFLPAVLTAADDSYLCGYWQFEDYFADHEATIRQAFTFPPLSEESERVADEIRRMTSASLHVRRGDYTRHEHLGFLDRTYYERAVEAIRKTAGDIRLFVFSDDPGWCTVNLDFPGGAEVVERPLPAVRAWEDMRLMSLCSHHVIANSTYSWWGAWLNPSPSKLVVAPRKWVRGESRVGDPVPSRWIRV